VQMAKRTNEHAQTSKEEYEAIENRENEPQGSLPQASADVMKRRRILNIQKKDQSEPIV
jgi:NUP50 (Nucleoporin 50 kDa)